MNLPNNHQNTIPVPQSPRSECRPPGAPPVPPRNGRRPLRRATVTRAPGNDSDQLRPNGRQRSSLRGCTLLIDLSDDPLSAPITREELRAKFCRSQPAPTTGHLAGCNSISRLVRQLATDPQRHSVSVIFSGEGTVSNTFPCFDTAWRKKRPARPALAINGHGTASAGCALKSATPSDEQPGQPTSNDREIC